MITFKSVLKNPGKKHFWCKNLKIYCPRNLKTVDSHYVKITFKKNTCRIGTHPPWMLPQNKKLLSLLFHAESFCISDSRDKIKLYLTFRISRYHCNIKKSLRFNNINTFVTFYKNLFNLYQTFFKQIKLYIVYIICPLSRYIKVRHWHIFHFENLQHLLLGLIGSWKKYPVILPDSNSTGPDIFTAVKQGPGRSKGGCIRSRPNRILLAPTTTTSRAEDVPILLLVDHCSYTVTTALDILAALGTLKRVIKTRDYDEFKIWKEKRRKPTSLYQVPSGAKRLTCVIILVSILDSNYWL